MSDPVGGREAEIEAVRAYFRKIGLAGPTVAQAEQVITALREAGMLRSSGSAAQNHEDPRIHILENELRIAREKVEVWEREFHRLAASGYKP